MSLRAWSKHVAMCMGILAITISSGGRAALASRSAVRLPSASYKQHAEHLRLYVSNGGTVAEYLLKDGEPKTRPENSFQTGQTAVFGFAVDRFGYVYVGYYDEKNNRLYVDVYPPGATGSPAPVRHLEIQQGLDSIAVDDEGYLYVSAWDNYSGAQVLIYAPGANGLNAPIQTISLPFNGIHFALALGTDGGFIQHKTLYVADQANNIYAYTNPVTNPRLARTFCGERSAVYLARTSSGLLFIGSAGLYRGPNQGIPALRETDTRCP